MQLDQVIATIQSGQSLSAAVSIGDKILVGLIIPAAWTTAGVTFQASGDGGTTFGELVDATATAIAVSSIAGGAYTVVALDPTKLRGINRLKVRSGTVGTPVAQGSTVNVTLLTTQVT